MGKVRRVCISLEPTVLKKLDELAKAHGRSRSSMIWWLVRQVPEPSRKQEPLFRMDDNEGRAE
jgi:metal-responsive CopG/Arc/MetJ family transcriptional regulator